MASPVAHSRDLKSALRKAAIRATLAPSVHNTQPWQLRLTENTLELRADRSRQLTVLDPTRRQLLISCGCALFNARVLLAAVGVPVTVRRQPDPDDPDLLAVIAAADASAAPERIGALNTVVETRQTNRRRFSTEQVPDEVVGELVDAAAAEGAGLFVIAHEEHRISTAVLSQRADAEQNANAAYRAELRAWTSDDPNRRDGVPASAVPHVDAGTGDDIPIRDFDARGTGWLPTETRSSMRQCLLLLTTDGDDPAGWLRAGEALERIWLAATARGYAVSPLTQVIEVAHTRQQLRAELGLTAHPVVLLRIGRAPVTASSHRRRLADVLVEG
ncbi:MAG TPA: nitroreductase family protein [Jatrophihabitans sp.]|nr:nitroreductase family protein [Jatrophihabitans sp.]